MSDLSVQPTNACPRCGAKPRVRIGWRIAAMARGLPPSDVVVTTQCSWVQNRQRCNHIFPIRVRDLPRK